MTQKSAYIEAMKAQLDTLNNNMNTLQAKAEEAKDDVRDMYKAEIAKLQEQSKLAAAKLGEMKSASEERWDSMVAEMDKVRDAFVHSFHYFKSQI